MFSGSIASSPEITCRTLLTQSTSQKAVIICYQIISIRLFVDSDLRIYTRLILSEIS